ncbi:MAG: hypothetical protein U0838_05380 [Chloroflexota bacterium]
MTTEEAGASPIVVPPSQEARAEELVLGTIERGFGGDPHRLRSFVRVLQSALPDGTEVVLRGSAVAGRSFRTGDPFDAHGPGTSDLDIVVLGEPVRELFAEEAQYPGGINTLPLCDATPWVAPSLEPARRRAQAIARRPVSIQAQAPWFLELRARVQGQPYVILAAGG